MILHVIPYEKFTASFINFVHDNFYLGEHIFYIIGHTYKINIELKDDFGVFWFDSSGDLLKNSQFLDNIKKCDKIILNSLFGMIPFFDSSDEIVKKIYIVFWGKEIYDFREGNTIPIWHYNQWKDRNRFIDKKKAFIERANAVCTLVDGDYDILAKYCNPPLKHFTVMMGTANTYGLRSIANEPYVKFDVHKDNQPMRILLGNSASPENQHIALFRMLQRFKNENLEFVTVLSYGNSEYADKVISAGKEMFGDRFCPVTEFLSYDKYVDLLKGCAVALFNNNRQQAMGNIYIMTALGRKIYIRSDTSMWHTFVEQHKIKYCDIRDVVSESVETFTNFDEETANYNKNRLLDYCSNENVVKMWKNVFDS